MIDKGRGLLRNLSLRRKLLLTFLLLLLVIAAGITVSVNYYNQRFINHLMVESNRQMMREMNAQLDSIYDQVNQVYLTFNNQNLYEIFLEKEEETDFESIQRELHYENSMKNQINANNLQEYIKGTLLYAGPKHCAYVGQGAMDPQFSIEDSDWYQQFETGNAGKLVYGPVSEDFKSENSTKNTVFYYMRSWYIPPGSGILGQGRPFILFSINADVVTNVLTRFSKDTRGILVLDEDQRTLLTVNMEQEAQGQILELIRQNETELGGQGTYTDRQWAVTRIKNEKFGWTVYFAESTADAFRELNQLIRNIYLIILAAGGAAIVLALYLTRRIVMPIEALNQMMNKIEEKDVYLEIQTRDELGQIGERFNQMKRRIQDMSEKMYLSKMQEKEAQLSALQAQINPHFLYNTLDNIYCIAQLEESEAITSLTENLSRMMRYSMTMQNRYVPLVRELEHVKSYVDILNVRFDDSITLRLQVQEGAGEMEVLKLSLQPLAENAWNHGILPKAGHRGTIEFLVERKGDVCVVQVLDDGVGILPERCRELNRALGHISYETEDSKKGSGIALKNVNNRILLEDGEGFGVRLYPRKEGGCRVIVRMKLHQKE
ncbi:MAG: sensor histidine kinase [Lachnospiraceae bacterium]|nr:sensor histidine kinase [Lachnospiraceae bacterium]MCI9149522.1 sensor histidine kinase [Lachnospiraceae bacterium]